MISKQRNGHPGRRETQTRNAFPVPDLSALCQLARDSLAVMIAGGTFSHVAEVDECIACDVLSYLDAKTPLERRRLGSHVRRLCVGLGQTTATLNRSSGGTLRRILDSGGNWSTADGLNCMFELANAAARDMADNAQVQSEHYAAYAEVLRGRGGDDSTLRFTHVALLGPGAVSGGAGHILQQAACRPYIESAAEVTKIRLRIGPVCHEGCRDDQRIALNHAAALAADLWWLMRPHPVGDDEKEDRVTRMYFVTELPNCGKNDPLRDHFAATLAQSLLCQSLRSKSRTVLCNDNDNDLGRIGVLRPGWYKLIHRQTAAQVACRTYVREVERLLTARAAATLTDLKIECPGRPNPKAVQFTDLLALALSGQGATESLAMLAARSPEKFKPAGSIELSEGERLKLGELAERLDRFGPSFSDFKARVELVAALRPPVERKLRQIRAAHHRTRRRLQRRVAGMAGVLAWTFARRGAARLLAAAVPIPWKSRLLKQAFTKLQDAAAEYAQTTALCAHLSVAHRRLMFEESRSRTIIHRVLAAFEPFKAEHLASPPVKMLDIDKAWPVLRRLHGSVNITENRLTLSRLVEYVTAHGLQEIFGAEDRSAEALADAIRMAVPEWGPSFGRDATRTYKNRYRVLPPVEANLRDEIEKHCTAELREMVHYADSCAGGITAVAIDLSTPSPLEKGGLGQLFTAAARSAFRRTLEPNVFQQFYPDKDCQAAARWVADKLKIPWVAGCQTNGSLPGTPEPRQHQSQESSADFSFTSFL
jgi:hypothetical protein